MDHFKYFFLKDTITVEMSNKSNLWKSIALFKYFNTN